MDSSHFISNLWRWKCGLSEMEEQNLVSFEELLQTEWSIDFETLMRNRLILGAFRYGRLNSPNKPKYNRIGSILTRLDAYVLTGNKENLVDIANLCLCEFEECNHPNQHFESIDDGIHVKTL